MARRRAISGLLIAVLVELTAFLSRVYEYGRTVEGELAAHGGFYLVSLVLGVAAFTLFGLALGRTEERLSEANAELKRISNTDPLTGLHNLRSFHDWLAHQVAFAQRNQTSFSVVILDIDYFKKVNDEHGHAAGDSVLKALSAVFLANRRQEDFVARIGGEEFAVLLPGVHAADAKTAASRILSDVRALRQTWDGKPLAITVSAGVAELAGGENGPDLMARADVALYRAKQNGRDRVETA